MTTSMTPTHGDPTSPRAAARGADTTAAIAAVTADVGARPGHRGDSDRWLPDPSWPVPPRGWQLWAAAGAGLSPAGERESAKSRRSRVHSEVSMQHTDDVLSEMPRLTALEDASFTLPTRPAALVEDAWYAQERVDLLADRRARRRAPEGTARGFGILAALLVVSFLVGGVTGALIVIGVSTLLAASAALVRGHLSLTRVGGQRGAGLLLGAAVMALITGSVAAHDRPAATQGVIAALVPVSSDRTAGVPTPVVSETRTAYAAIPPSASRPAPAATPATAPRPASGAGADGTDESVASIAAEAATSGTAATPASPATRAVPATPAQPGTQGSAATPATPAKPAKPAKPASGASAAVSGLTKVGVALTLSPDALSPKPAPVAPKPKRPTGIGTPVSAPPSAKPGSASQGAKAPKAAKASTSSKAAKARTSGAATKPAKRSVLATG